jgi:probable HAF family extracellular repeat protein
MSQAQAQTPGAATSIPHFGLFDLGPVDIPGNIAGSTIEGVQRTPVPLTLGVPASLASGVQLAPWSGPGSTLDGTPNSCIGFAGFAPPPAFELQAVGTCLFKPSPNPPEWHAVLWIGNQITDVGILPNAQSQPGGPPPGPVSRAFNMNSVGDVVGVSDTGYTNPARHPAYHAFLWNGGVMQDLGTLLDAQHDSEAIAVNDSHEVVGWSDAVVLSDGSEGQHAFLYTHGQMYDLNDLLEGAPPTTRLILAEAISCEGHITALGYDTRVSDGTSGVGGRPREHAYFLARIGPPRNCLP